LKKFFERIMRKMNLGNLCLWSQPMTLLQTAWLQL